MREHSRLALPLSALVAAAAVAGCRMTPQLASAAVVETAHATLADSAGRTVGTALLTQDAAGVVHLHVDATGLAVGEHGIHFHTIGSCTGPTFTSAGGHYNPTAKHHGLDNPQGPHGGDLPNFVVSGDHATMDATTNRVTLTSGPLSLLDADGSALVIHAGRDDQTTDPAGNSGARIVCGVITRG